MRQTSCSPSLSSRPPPSTGTLGACCQATMTAPWHCRQAQAPDHCLCRTASTIATFSMLQPTAITADSTHITVLLPLPLPPHVVTLTWCFASMLSCQTSSTSDHGPHFSSMSRRAMRSCAPSVMKINPGDNQACVKPDVTLLAGQASLLRNVLKRIFLVSDDLKTRCFEPNVGVQEPSAHECREDT